jgi:integrase
LELLENKEITIQRLAVIKDIFLFSCYTGFAYIDVCNLTTDHFKTGADGRKWLIKFRHKTGIPERVPLLPRALNILEKYQDFSRISNGKLLPVPSNQKVNAYLKELAIICDIHTPLTFHVARHTFATTIAFENGVVIESVSAMLGHKYIKTTQIYARVSDRKISEDTKGMFKNLS